MNKKEKSHASQNDPQQPGSMSSFNNRPDNRQGKVEDVKEEKNGTESGKEDNSNQGTNTPKNRTVYRL